MDTTGPRESRGTGGGGAGQTGNGPIRSAGLSSHALFGPWVTQRIATGAGQAQATRIRRRSKRKLPEMPKTPGDLAAGTLRHRGEVEDS